MKCHECDADVERVYVLELRPAPTHVPVVVDANPRVIGLADNAFVWAEIIGSTKPLGELMPAGTLHKVHVCTDAV